MQRPPLRLLLLALCATPALAQDGHSRSVGFLVQTIPAGQTRSFSIPFDADLSSLPGATGRLTTVGSNYVENSAAGWPAGAFSQNDAPYFLRLTSGVHSGRAFRIVTPANTATRLYIADDGLGLASLGLETGATGARYEIVPGDTLASFFGTEASPGGLVLQGAANPFSADIVQVWGGASWLNFYYNTTWHRWARDSDVVTDPSRDAFLLRSDRGLMLTRRGTTPLELTVLGRVLATPQRAFHSRQENALTFLATMQTSDTTLANLALQSSSRSSAWRGAADWTDADLLVVWSGASWFGFFYNTSVGHWQRIGDPVNRDGFVIRTGTPVFVQRRTSGTTADDKTIVFPAPGS
jgi:hypothetical protein